MPPTNDKDESIETKRVQFWVEADAPITFDSDKLSNIAYSLAITTVRQIGHGESIDHGYETDDGDWRTSDAGLLTEAEWAGLNKNDGPELAKRIQAANVLMVQRAIERVFPGANPLSLTKDERIRVFKSELFKDRRFKENAALRLFSMVLAQLGGDEVTQQSPAQIPRDNPLLARKRPARGDA
jgi:hypothetical protein